jgi:hypothetical protein
VTGAEDSRPPVSPPSPSPPVPAPTTPSPALGPSAAQAADSLVWSNAAEADRAAADGRTRRKSLGIGAAVAAAVASAVVGAVLNPSLLGAAWHKLAGDSGSGASASPVPTATPAPTLTLRTNKRNSIAVKAPLSWGSSARAPFNVFGTKTPGDTLVASTDIQGKLSASVSHLYIAASHDAVSRLHITSRETALPILQAKLREPDWTIDGCRLTGEVGYPDASLVGVMREWAECDGLADATLWEAYALTADGSALINIQFNTRAADVDRATAEAMMSSILIDPARLSG